MKWVTSAGGHGPDRIRRWPRYYPVVTSVLDFYSLDSISHLSVQLSDSLQCFFLSKNFTSHPSVILV